MELWMTDFQAWKSMENLVKVWENYGSFALSNIYTLARNPVI